MSRAIARLRSRCGARGDSGQIMVMTIGFMMIALLLIVVVTTITAIQLDRTKLWDIADSAALNAAGSIDLQGHYGPGEGGQREITLSDATVTQGAAAYLTDAPPAGSLHGVRMVSAHSPDGRSAVVVLEATSRPGLLGWLSRGLGLPSGVGLQVESTARAQ